MILSALSDQTQWSRGHEFLLLHRKALRSPAAQWCPSCSSCSDADGEGVTLMFLHPFQKQPGSFFYSQDFEQTTNMPGWDLSLISDPNNCKMNPYIWDKESDHNCFIQCPKHVLECQQWQTATSLNYHFLNCLLKVH